MAGTVRVDFVKPITSVKILDNNGADAGFSGQGQAASGAAGQAGYDVSQICHTLQTLVGKLNQLYDKLLVEHKKEIARFSVEIARKILVQKVEEGDYEIQSIVEEALNNAPTRQDLVVHLNPADFAQCQKLQQEDSGGPLSGIKFVSDSNIGRAECVLESDKGRVESLINDQLEKIGKALEKAE